MLWFLPSYSPTSTLAWPSSYFIFRPQFKYYLFQEASSKLRANQAFLLFTILPNVLALNVHHHSFHYNSLITYLSAFLGYKLPKAGGTYLSYQPINVSLVLSSTSDS